MYWVKKVCVLMVFYSWPLATGDGLLFWKEAKRDCYVALSVAKQGKSLHCLTLALLVEL